MTSEYIGFPPGKHYLTRPAGNRKVAVGGLALYDATFLHQRFALSTGRLLLRFGIERPFRLRYQPPVPDWWDRWLTEVAEPMVGPVADTAFRLPGLADFAQGSPRFYSTPRAGCWRLPSIWSGMSQASFQSPPRSCSHPIRQQRFAAPPS